MTHSHVWHDSFICVTWLNIVQLIPSWEAAFHGDAIMRITWLLHMRGMTHSYVWYDSFICVTWLIIVQLIPLEKTSFPMMHSYVWHDSCIRVTWLILSWRTWLNHMCDMTDPFLVIIPQRIPSWEAVFTGGLFICMTWLIHVRQTWHIYMCDMTHSYAWHDEFPIIMAHNIFFLRSRLSRRLIHMRDMTHSYMIDMTHSYLRHDSFLVIIPQHIPFWEAAFTGGVFIRVTWLIHIWQTWSWFICAPCLIDMRDMMNSPSSWRTALSS